VILSFNYRSINAMRDLLEAQLSVIGSSTEVIVFRNQKAIKKWVELENK